MAYSTNQHAEWLSLIEVSGPFLAEPILNQAFPQGLEKVDPVKKRQFRQTYDEWREVIDSNAQQDIQIKDKIHQQWINWVLKFGLELDEDEDEDGDILKNQSQMHASIQVIVPEHQVIIKPEYAVVANEETQPYMLVQTYPAGTALSEVLRGDSWSTSPAERMAHLCRGVGTRLGLITNGEQWMFIDAPAGGITTYASWYARLWGLEPVTLKAFYSLFNIGIVFNGFDDAKTLPQLIDESLQYQDDVTQKLGIQVSRAVEVLIQSIDRINHDHNGELLEGVEPEELYEAGLTLMMRLVFLLCAEERGLLLLGDQAYEANYALSTLRAKLREDASLHGDEVLSYRKNAWARLLAIFRSVYSGVEHENMRMPALGGSLFDPDRFPFLEGRKKGSNWLEDEAKPLPIDNRTVLLFLDAIQLYQGRTLSYRALDVEQIGYVYEGLLEKTVKRAPDVTLELSGSKSCKKPWVQLGELASASLDGETALKRLLKERTASSASRITNDLAKEVTDADVDKLLVACYNDSELCQRIKPYYHFLRFDAWGNPLLYPKDAYMLTTGSERRETGSHYTPKSLTESIVTETLEPVVYIGPAEGKARDEWQLKSPEALLDLKICDPAMGSGAFLVQVCRWLAERVCESWLIAEQGGVFITTQGATTTDDSQELIPIDAEERLIVAKRLISERCLYGVDINPLAVELAKLSIWLVTLSKDRPFGFLDHNLKSGDSLLGIHNLDQLCYLHLNPSQVKKSKLVEQPFTKKIKEAVADTLELRKQIVTHDINLVSDIDEMSQLEEQAREKILLPKLIADALVGSVLESDGKLPDIPALSSYVQQAVAGDEESIKTLGRIANRGLSADLSGKKKIRQALHWNLEFPEVFLSSPSGFDAIVGNPPFLGGKRISGTLGSSYREYLVNHHLGSVSGSADLVVSFLRYASNLINSEGCVGLITVNSISEGDSRKVGLEQLILKGVEIYSAHPNETWPGNASVSTSRVHLYNGNWLGTKLLSGVTVENISSFLSNDDSWTPKKLKVNKNKSFKGSNVLGLGFTLSKEEADDLINTSNNEIDVLFPYLNGKDFNSTPKSSASRWIISYWDWPKERAEKYSHSFNIVINKVKPERQRKKDNGEYKLREPLPTKWWVYNDKKPALYHAIGCGAYFEKHPKNWDATKSKKKVVLSRVITSKHHAFAMVPNKYIFDQTLVLFDTDSFKDFAICQSTVHFLWALKQGSSLESRPRYNPANCFETFPFPTECFGINNDSVLSELGRAYHEKRMKFMLSNNIGLTKFYNLFHSQTYTCPDITEIRNLHNEIDKAVLKLYQWNDLNSELGFRPLSLDGGEVRFSLPEDVVSEIVKRLTQLNLEYSFKE
ncbi:Eco57I restriction-modification methylase domain-containing protein [Photobacterium sanguinicancri]|uniref:Eco57I restriction-modification methylase domain-containing protein n=1 Tax=Photobacterium sanguinicancri TaxID=875932 RepID=UPI0026E3E130|nr:DNA methyltransferase [Photobacterium sanguinicancri]MDO6497743.1 hypothetical protein [Photobacterium sanguinicancri]